MEKNAPVTRPKGRMEYTREDEINMIAFVMANHLQTSAKGRRAVGTWKRAEQEQVTSHTWQSMREHWKGCIEPVWRSKRQAYLEDINSKMSTRANDSSVPDNRSRSDEEVPISEKGDARMKPVVTSKKACTQAPSPSNHTTPMTSHNAPFEPDVIPLPATLSASLLNNSPESASSRSLSKACSDIEILTMKNNVHGSQTSLVGMDKPVSYACHRSIAPPNMSCVTCDEAYEGKRGDNCSGSESDHPLDVPEFSGIALSPRLLLFAWLHRISLKYRITWTEAIEFLLEDGCETFKAERRLQRVIAADEEKNGAWRTPGWDLAVKSERFDGFTPVVRVQHEQYGSAKPFRVQNEPTQDALEPTNARTATKE